METHDDGLTMIDVFVARSLLLLTVLTKMGRNRTLSVFVTTPYAVQISTVPKGWDVMHIHDVITKMEQHRTPHASVARVSAVTTSTAMANSISVVQNLIRIWCTIK